MKWEYKIITFRIAEKEETINKEFNQLGNEGWELISCFTRINSFGEGKGEKAVFKRMK